MGAIVAVSMVLVVREAAAVVAVVTVAAVW